MQSPHEQRGHGVPHQYPMQSPHEQRGHGVPHQYPIQSPHEQRGHGVPHQYPMQSPHEQRGHGASQQYPMQSPHEQRGHGASQQYPMQSPHEQRGHGVPQSYQSQSIPASPFAASPVAEATSYTEQEYLHTWDIPDIGAIISSKDKDTVQSSANAFQTQPGMLPYASDYALSDDPTPAVIKLGSEPPESQELTLSKREKQALSEKGWAYGSREVQSLQYDLENFESDIESLEFDTIRAETPIQSPEQRRPKTPAPDTIPMKRPHLDQQADTSDNDTLKNSYASKPLDYNFRPSGNMATPDGLQRLDIAKTPKNQTPSRAELALSSDQQIDLGDQAMLQNSPPLDPNRHPDHKDVNHELPTLKGSSANSHNDSPTSHPPVLSPAQWSSRPPEYDLSETSTENQTSSTNSPPDTEQMSVAESIMPPLPRPKLSENFSFALNTQLPPLWRRFCAGIIDLLLLGVIAGTITKVFGPQLKQTLPKGIHIVDLITLVLQRYQIHFLYGIMVFAIGYFVYATALHTLFGQTLGKKLFGIRVISSTGTKLRWFAALARSLSFIIFFALNLFGILWILVDKEYRAVHDRISGTLVILHDPLSIIEAEDAKPKKSKDINNK
jgi:uncharacterized RDD family membrane protein YckC